MLCRVPPASLLPQPALDRFSISLTLALRHVFEENPCVPPGQCSCRDYMHSTASCARSNRISTTARFLISLPPLIGMRDFIRIVQIDEKSPEVISSKFTSTLLPVKCTDAEWTPRIGSSSCQLVTYIVLPCEDHRRRIDSFCSTNEQMQNISGDLCTSFRCTHRETASGHTECSFREHPDLDKSTKTSEKDDQYGIYAVVSAGVQPLSFEGNHHFYMEMKPARLHESLTRTFFIHCGAALTVSAASLIRFYSNTRTHMNVLAIIQTVSTSGLSAPRSTMDQPRALLHSTSTLSSFSTRTMPYERKDEALRGISVNCMDGRHNFEDRASGLSGERGTSNRTVVGVIPTIKGISSSSFRVELMAKQMAHGALYEQKNKETSSSAAALNAAGQASEKANTVLYHICTHAQSQTITNLRSTEVLARSDPEASKTWKNLDMLAGCQNISESGVMVSDVRSEALWETWSGIC